MAAELSFCGTCGHQADAATSPDQRAQLREAWDPRTARRSPAKRRVLAAVALALLALGFAAVMLGGSDGQQADSVAQPGVETLEPDALAFPPYQSVPDAPAWKEGYQLGTALDDVPTRAKANARCDELAAQAYGDEPGAYQQLWVGCIFGWIAIQQGG